RTNATPVIEVLDEFLVWLAKRVEEGTKAPRTYDWYEKYINSIASFGDDRARVRDLTVDQLQPIHVYRWVDSHPAWKAVLEAEDERTAVWRQTKIEYDLLRDEICRRDIHVPPTGYDDPAREFRKHTTARLNELLDMAQYEVSRFPESEDGLRE